MKLTSLLLLVAIVAAPALAFHPNEECDSCHVPHGAINTASNMPLWSPERTLVVAQWTNYSSATMDATDVGDPEGSALLCLSCHDNSGGNHYVISGASGDLAGTHPMEFEYTDTLAGTDGELVDPTQAGSSTVVGGVGTITDDLLTSDGKLSCISCHDVHVQGLHETGTIAQGTIYASPYYGAPPAAVTKTYLWDDAEKTIPTMVDGKQAYTTAQAVAGDDHDFYAEDDLIFELEEVQATDPGTGDLLWEDAEETIPTMVTQEVLVDGQKVIVLANGINNIDFSMPHLVNIPGMTYKTGWGGDAGDSADYAISYGKLCTTCHIK
jgi:hypothetical protein